MGMNVEEGEGMRGEGVESVYQGYKKECGVRK